MRLAVFRTKSPGDLNRAGFAAAIGVLLLHVALTPVDFVDDAFIVFRYAWNLAHGHGPVFNPGEYVEGYSSQPWMLLARLVVGSSIPLAPFMRIAALIGMILVVFLVNVFLEGERNLVRVGAMMLVALSGPWMRSGFSGLETPLFSLMLVMTALAFDRFEARLSMGSAVFLGGAGGVLAWTRPEGAGVFLVAWMVMILCAKPVARPLLYHALGIFLGIVAVLVLWRQAVYSAWMPNSVIAKAGPGSGKLDRLLSAESGAGVLYIGAFVLWCAYAFLPLLAVLRERARRNDSAPIRAAVAAVVAMGIAGIFVAFANLGDWMPDYRLLSPYVPVWVMAGMKLRPPKPAIVGALVMAMAMGPAHGRLRINERFFETRTNGVYECVAEVFNSPERTSGPFRPRIAAVNVGKLSFYAPRTDVLDLCGLTHSDFGRSEPGTSVYGRLAKPESVRPYDPLAVVLNSEHLSRVYEENGWFRENYRGIHDSRLPKYDLYIYLRKNAPWLAEHFHACGRLRRLQKPSRPVFPR